MVPLQVGWFVKQLFEEEYLSIPEACLAEAALVLLLNMFLKRRQCWE